MSTVEMFPFEKEVTLYELYSEIKPGEGGRVEEAEDAKDNTGGREEATGD